MMRRSRDTKLKSSHWLTIAEKSGELVSRTGVNSRVRVGVELRTRTGPHQLAATTTHQLEGGVGKTNHTLAFRGYFRHLYLPRYILMHHPPNL